MFPTKANFFATPSPNADEIDGALTELLRVLRSKPRAGGRVTILRQEAVRAVPDCQTASDPCGPLWQAVKATLEGLGWSISYESGEGPFGADRLHFG